MSNEQVQINQTEIVNDLLLIQWSNETDSAIPLIILRDNCPCAGCVGEKDALGNTYIGPPKKLTPLSYRLKGIQPVGYYGLRPFWADGHATGIYTIDQLLELSQEKS
ncbi:MAG: DUF971 domain-containing protein [Fidelibacterota bacterium]